MHDPARARSISEFRPRESRPLVRYRGCFYIGVRYTVLDRYSEFGGCSIFRSRKCIAPTGIAVGISTVVRYTEEVRYSEGLLSEDPLYLNSFLVNPFKSRICFVWGKTSFHKAGRVATTVTQALARHKFNTCPLRRALYIVLQASLRAYTSATIGPQRIFRRRHTSTHTTHARTYRACPEPLGLASHIEKFSYPSSVSTSSSSHPCPILILLCKAWDRKLVLLL